MQTYMKLKLQELSDSFDLKMSDEWDNAVVSESASGFTLSNDMSFRLRVDIGIKYLDKFIDEALSVVKTTLLGKPTLPPTNDFNIFKKEMIQHIDKRIERIFLRSEDREEWSEDLKQEYAARIGTKIDCMQEELRLKIVSHGGTVINVGGDAIVNTGTVYGSIHQHIEKMKDTGSADVAELFDKLFSAIKDSQISEEQRNEQMQNVEYLVAQYETQPEKRNKGLISASMNLLSMAANLTTLWPMFGPAIIEAFK